MHGRRDFASRAALKATGWVTLLGAFFGLHPSSSAAAEPSSYKFKLDYAETSEALILRGVGAKLLSVPFKKEPALPKQEVVRGLLQWGPPSEQPIPFIWNRQESKLYLDLNRNRDLTDDPKGVFVGGTNIANQVFTNVPLDRITAVGTHPMLVRLELRLYGANNLVASAGLCSYWQAKVRLQGGDCQFGIVENILDAQATISPQYLLWRPWAERERPFYLATSSADFADYSSTLFLENRNYSLDCRYDPQGPAPCYLATLGEQPASFGELKITGSSIHRLILKEDKGLVAILDKPQGILRIPSGSYAVEEIWLRDKDLEVARFKAGKLKVPEGEVAPLTAGGPLTNSVSAQSSGYNLSLTYQLLGADGGVYHLPRPDYQRPPEFAISEGTNRLATGKFAFG